MECSEIHDVRDHCARTFVRADEAGRMVPLMSPEPRGSPPLLRCTIHPTSSAASMVGVRGQADSVLAMLADQVGVALGAVR